MCTIITADSTIEKKSLIERVQSDAMSNSDGFAMLMILSNAKPLFIQSIDVDAIAALIELYDYERVFIHTRYATQGDAKLSNCHGWSHDGTYVFHNGSIRAKIAERFDVDSEAIRHWLANYGLDETLNLLLNEPFANVLLPDLDDGVYYVHRSSSGSLFTDGSGNFSTHAFGPINVMVPDSYQGKFMFYVENYPDDYGTGYFTDDRDDSPQSYMTSWDSWDTAMTREQIELDDWNFKANRRKA